MADYYKKMFKPFIGGEIVQAGSAPDEEFGSLPAIMVKCKDGKTRTVYFLCDEEGNGPGAPSFS